MKFRRRSRQHDLMICAFHFVSTTMPVTNVSNADDTALAELRELSM